ncbi:Type-2 restriction enzyme PaeR7I [Planctomycetes bacterium Pan216]|uniref:Type-2 restriction enzyme PaeR7I n=1 Tax=Kolteria novifilia TaxID=2527975 RepID=A0A518B424_9BACT|nr:Type-2 restriction enzyme PaeR7I [Planctomycetes bacterium Pan216]
MSIDLGDFEENVRNAVLAFWNTRQESAAKQEAIGRFDQGQRSGVTSGKNMDGFVGFVADIVQRNGIAEECIYLKRRVLSLPGYFRPTKLWDMLVIHNDHLVAALEFKSQAGSFGNNFNNRTEEALGTALDLMTAFREGAFGDQPRPFVGWMMLLEDAPSSRKPVGDRSPHFPAFPEFAMASYAKRYHILCRKMMQENLYDAAALLLSPRGKSGVYSEMDTMTSLRTFATQLAGRVAAEVA